ncbi:hypothetical protein GYMLUDRAFT_50207 [Collybiopsis luxurians FD-317 M1]|uniref:F-box domain-containing protein n=1 Tax=Collybiopsis luxurians FD-317 M1 TaxID=944289 RepID=A0A0D0CB03_9AGAR|nr:hypothetical protein GYMLUDRAFT_50207 [Collybiopsis luxurians FD-317 M1]
MVTADNLHLNVLELIFYYLSGNDLVSVSLASCSFLSGIMFQLNHAKRFPQVMSPFKAIVEHPALAVHTRHIAIPTFKSQHHPRFLSECTQALSLCTNLQSFRCTVSALSPFLVPLQGKERLQELQVHGNLTTAQSKKLAQIPNLTSLCLDFGSRNLIDVLPRWTPNFAKTLSSLCLYSASELNETVLDKVLEQLPGLLALHIVGCGQVNHVAVMRLVSHTPLLETLSFSTSDSSYPLRNPAPPLQHLRHLGLDARYSVMSSPAPQVLMSILNHIQSSAPSLFKMTAEKDFIEHLVKLHGSTLQTMAFNCGLSLDSIMTISKTCTSLERLELPIPLKELMPFASSIGKASNLRLLIDTSSHSGHGHGPNVSLTQENARYLMRGAPHLRKIVSGRRVWKNASIGSIDLSLEQLPSYSSATYWFMPQDVTDFGVS